MAIKSTNPSNKPPQHVLNIYYATIKSGRQMENLWQQVHSNINYGPKKIKRKIKSINQKDGPPLKSNKR
jgi:hypothetical protein